MRQLIIILFLFTALISEAFAQRETDMGISGGLAYYMGDINPSQPFYAPNLNLGFIYRYNLNKHYVLKGEANYLRLNGNDLDFSNQFQQSRGANFTNNLLDLSLQFEFNFLPLKFEVRKIGFTPFVSAGAAYVFSLNNENMFAVPFAMGVKLSVSKNWSFGLAWNHRKTFNDKIDRVENLVPDSYRSMFNNNDWYSFANVFITYKIFDFRAECPAYMKTY